MLATYQVLIGISGLVATILDSTALEYSSCDKDIFLQYNHQNKEANTATLPRQTHNPFMFWQSFQRCLL